MSNHQQAVNQKQQLAKQKLEHYLEYHEAIKEAIEEIIYAAKHGWPLDDFWSRIRFELKMMWDDAFHFGKEEVKQKVMDILNRS